ncbi:MAG: EamA family transporter [Pseudomonadales bacterium]
MPLAHQFLAIVVAFIWGSNFVVIHHGLQAFPPFTFAVLRFVFVAIPLVFIFAKPNTSWSKLAAYGLFIGCGQFGLLFWAMKDHITPGLASLIIQMQIFITILLAALIHSELVSKRQLLALLVCFGGLSIIILNTDEYTTVPGVLITLAAATSWAAGNLVAKGAGKVNILAFLSWSSLFAVPPLALLALCFEGWPAISSSITSAGTSAWAVVLWQSVGNTLIGYGLWNMLLARYPAAVVTPWALLVPVFGMSASALLLAEPMPWWKLLAMLLMLLGLGLNSLAAQKRVDQQPSQLRP